MDADFQFAGNGPEGAILAGVERKEISDLLSSMRSNRLAGSQIGKMIRTYDVSYLIVEGLWRRGRDGGVLETPYGREWAEVRGRITYSEMTRFLASLREQGGVRVWRTMNPTETAAYLVEEFSWWQKQWKDHHTSQTIYVPELQLGAQGHKPHAFRRAPSLTELWAHALPRVDSRAAELAGHFSSPKELANADVNRWLQIKDMRIARPTAENFVRLIEGR